jgi:drug/metabolite transporter (DMT)-like permease
MLFIILRALCNTAFAQLLRLSQSRRPRTLGVITVNYLVATLVSLALAAGRGGVRYLPPTVGFGVLGGVGYIVSILLLMPAMRASGLAVAMAVLQLAVLVPVAFAMVAFHEMPSPSQALGIVLATVALVLLSLARTVPLKAEGGGRKAESGREGGRRRAEGGIRQDSDGSGRAFVGFRLPPSAFRLPFRPPLSALRGPLLLVLFGVTGVSGIAMKAFHEYAPARELPGFMAILFAVATTGGALAAVQQREAFALPDLVLGTAVGIANAAQLAFLLRALETVPAIIVFPVSSALALVLNALASIVCWGERLDSATALGLALALAATVLLNAR